MYLYLSDVLLSKCGPHDSRWGEKMVSSLSLNGRYPANISSPSLPYLAHKHMYKQNNYLSIYIWAIGNKTYFEHVVVYYWDIWFHAPLAIKIVWILLWPLSIFLVLKYFSQCSHWNRFFSACFAICSDMVLLPWKEYCFCILGTFLSFSTSFCAFSNVNSYHSQFFHTLHKPSVQTIFGICCTEMVFHQSGQLQNAFLVFPLIRLFCCKICMKILKPFRFGMPYLSDGPSPW